MTSTTAWPGTAWPGTAQRPAVDTPASAVAPRLRSVCVEGWRGVNHSIAMINQHQLLAMLETPGLQVCHRDLPYFLKHWTPALMPAGFSPADQQRIADVPPPADGQRFDTLLRITSPFRTAFDPAQRTLSFMVTECGLVPECFDAPAPDLAAYTRGENAIVTPSVWSRDRLVEYGLDAERIHVVPHGVKADTFCPMHPIERLQARRALGVPDGETLFLNVGVATWNKGLDLLLAGFARLRQRRPGVRLLLKDHRDLYRMGVEHTLAEVRKSQPGLVTDEVLASISVVSGSLDQAQMRALYAAADAYVSPYRAEGFNLPVLEAMACGTPVIVTDGGATDDFCPANLALRLPSREGRAQEATALIGRFRVPRPDALLEAMDDIASGRVPRDDPAREAARAALVARLDWPAVTARLVALL